MPIIGRMLTKGVLVFSLFSFSCLLSAHANVADADNWEFHLAPYGWLAGQSGQVGTFPNLPPADIDIDFYDDVLGNINGAFMLVGEARKRDFGIIADIVYTDIDLDGATPGAIFQGSLYWWRRKKSDLLRCRFLADTRHTTCMVEYLRKTLRLAYQTF